ncbi:piezo-type mechanosensitive ion channel component 2 isoform X4 [Tachysurus ichikawai]
MTKQLSGWLGGCGLHWRCGFKYQLIAQLSLKRSVRGADAGNGIRVFIPDIGMFIAGLVTWLLCRSLEKPPGKDMLQHNTDFDMGNQEQDDDEEEEEETDEEEKENDEKLELEPDLHLEEDFELGDEDCEPHDEDLDIGQEDLEGLEPEEEEEESTKIKILRQIAEVASRLKEIIGNLIATAGKVVVTILLGFTGIMLPSLTSAMYFFTFLGLCTWWSFCRSFDTLLFSCLCVLMAIFSAGHLIILYLYQFQFFQEAVPPGDRYASLFGISPVVLSDCSHTWMFKVNPELDWYHFVNPIMLLVLYYTLATLVRLWLQEPVNTQIKKKEGEARVTEENEQSPVSTEVQQTAEKKREMWRMARYLPDERKVLIVTSNGGPMDLMTLSREHRPVSAELYSTPKYKSHDESDKERMHTSVYEISPVLSGVPGFPERTVQVNAVVKIFRFVMKQSYICALIAMMAWSITYVSWLTFVFLIWSCTLWMVRDRRKYAMITSPFMVFYGDLLIILQYIWSFQTLQPVPGLFLKKEVPFRELGSKILCLLSFWLLLRQALTERSERQKDDTQLSDIRVEDTSKEKYMDGKVGGQREMMDVLGSTLMAMLNKYWIYICGGMFFFVSFEGRIVMYKIIYMMLFLFCVALYQLNYERWRWMLKYFWMSVVVYTMLVLILIYTFQFESSLHVWSNMTGLSKEKLEDLGLERFSVPALFTRIFIPTSFLLVCILHLHYFHERFLQLTDIKAVVDKQKSTISRLVHLDGSLADLAMIKPEFNPSEKDEEIGEKVDLDIKDEDDIKIREEKDEEICDVFCKTASFTCHILSEPEPDHGDDLKNKWHLVMDRLTVLFLKFLQYVYQLQLFIWWLLELHVIKIVSSYIIWVSVKEVSLFNYVFLVSWAFALPFSQFRPLASSMCTVWTCVIIVCKMLYQLTSIQPATFSKNCSMPDNYTDVQRLDMVRSLLYSSPVDPANWVGLKKFSPLLENLRNNLLMLALLAFEVTVYRHQEFYRMRNNLTAPVTRTIFHNITRQHLDDGIINCAKYFINYFFYKFGLETCFLLAVNVIGQRMDFCAMLHAFGLIAVLYQRRRKAIAGVWPKYCFFLACMLTYQYLICIGIPPAACSDYPWRRPSSTMDSNVVKWLYLPDFHTKPNPLFLLYDFMLLLCASLQRHVFEEENDHAVRLLAGDNVEICRDLDAATFSQHNPVPDFIHCRSYLDMLKVIMFSYLFWFVLTIIFITGTTRISIFCMGYLVACFYFLLFGGELLLKPIKTIMRYWDFLIAYNVFVITMKNILSIAACGYIKSLVVNHCWLIQLFSLACTIKGYSRPEQQANKQCELPSDEAGIIWDSICFASLLLQRRVFMSYYFLHVVADIRSSQVLASRGAELFQATIVKAVKARLEEEKKSMDLLKRQMDRIKSRQQKFKRGKERMLSLAQESGESQSLYREEVEDDGETSKETRKGKRKQWWRPWVDHASMVRSGNYYLFETDSEEEEEEEEKKEEDLPKKSAFQRAIRMFASALLALPKSVIKLPKTILQYAIRAAKFVYHAWITDSKTAMKERNKERRRFWQRYTEGRKTKKDQREAAPVTIEVADQVEDTVEQERSDVPDNILKRVFNIVKFSWVLFLALLDSFTAWLNSMCQEYIDISTVLRTERCMLTHEVKKVTIVIKYFFQFGFFPFNQNIELDKSKPFHPPNIIGVEKKEGYVHYDLIQLLALFFHRSILKCHGLWDKDDTRPEAKKTLYSHSDSDTEKPPVRRERSSLTRNILTEATSVRMQRKLSNTPSTMRRHSSSAGSHISHRSTRSRGGSSVTRSSMSRVGSVSGVQQKSRKELILVKFREQLIKAKKFTVKITLDIYVPIRQFFYNLIHPEYSAVTDVYVLMFLADTVDFIIIVFGFWAFGKHSAAADITSSLSEDQVPEAFLVMVLIQFATMVVDRALYLRKTVMGKVIFQVILVFGIHFWMFFILPGVTERRFSQNMVAQLWYFVKCIYFGLSAYQIRCGYPTRVLGNFLTKSYNYVNLFLFQGFRLVPFLTELRAVMDWVWTDTTLSLSNWICVEDIYAHIFVLKCWRESEKRYPQPRGQKKKKVVKYGMGGMIVMLLICIVWFPLLFMSLVKSVAGVVNKPLDVSVTITLGGFQPIFTMSAQQNQLKDITEAEFQEFMNSYNYIPSAMQFLEAYTAEDVTVAELEGSSNSLWTISPPSRKNLMDVLSKEDQFPVTMSWTIQRNLSLGAKAEIAMDKHVTYLDMNTRQELIDLLNGTRNKAVVIKQVFPCFIRAPSDSNAKPIEQLYKEGEYKNILLDLERTNNSSGEIQEWWIVDQPSAEKINIRFVAKAALMGEAGLQLYVFNDKVSPPSLGFLAGYGIMGLYASVVLVIGKFVREFFSGISHSIMFEELPCVDRILKLCTDIFLVRETGELELEEDLYAKLIFLYRSPETMIKWTREKTK